MRECIAATSPASGTTGRGGTLGTGPAQITIRLKVLSHTTENSSFLRSEGPGSKGRSFVCRSFRSWYSLPDRAQSQWQTPGTRSRSHTRSVKGGLQARSMRLPVGQLPLVLHRSPGKCRRRRKRSNRPFACSSHWFKAQISRWVGSKAAVRFMFNRPTNSPTASLSPASLDSTGLSRHLKAGSRGTAA